MKAEELMVGDFILVERNEGIYGGPVWKQPGKVLEIYKDEIKVLFADENGDNEYDEILTFLPHEVDGLLITPEILEKNGFVEEEYPIIYDRREFELRHGDYRIIVSPLNDGYTRIYKGGYLPILNNCYINFVHELQHALRLCGIDKEIEL